MIHELTAVLFPNFDSASVGFFHVNERTKAPLPPIYVHTDLPPFFLLTPHDIPVTRCSRLTMVIPRILKLRSFAKVCNAVIIFRSVDVVDTPTRKNPIDVEPRKPVGRVNITPYGDDSVTVAVEATGYCSKFSSSSSLNPNKISGKRIVGKCLPQALLGKSVLRSCVHKRKRPAARSGDRYWPSEGKPSNPRHEFHFAPRGWLTSY